MATKKPARPRGEFAVMHRHSGYPGVMEAFTVRVIARGEGYAMVRRKGCAPFIVDEKDLINATATKRKGRSAAEQCAAIVAMIEAVEDRCMAVDGPVTPTHQEITDEELRRIYVAAKKGAKNCG